MKVKTDVKPPLDKVAKPFRKSKRQLIGDGLRPLARRIRDNIRDEAPSRSGNLRSAIVDKEINLLTYQVTIDQRKKAAKYEAAVRLGVPAASINPIVPRRKKALFWPGLPHPIKIVRHHPGIKSNPYFDRGIEKSQADITKTANELGIKIEQELTGN